MLITLTTDKTVGAGATARQASVQPNPFCVRQVHNVKETVKVPQEVATLVKTVNEASFSL